ncbi:Uncharacterised protein [Mycobacterium tuberculosis]|nr:Uncharacterised protein [Mycobacterium tuberculosis]
MEITCRLKALAAPGSGNPPNVLTRLRPASTRTGDNSRGTDSSFTLRTRSPVVVLISATASVRRRTLWR